MVWPQKTGSAVVRPDADELMGDEKDSGSRNTILARGSFARRTIRCRWREPGEELLLHD